MAQRAENSPGKALILTFAVLSLMTFLLDAPSASAQYTYNPLPCLKPYPPGGQADIRTGGASSGREVKWASNGLVPPGEWRNYSIQWSASARKCFGQTQIVYFLTWDTRGWPDDRWAEYRFSSRSSKGVWRPACPEVNGERKCVFRLDPNTSGPLPGARPIYQLRTTRGEYITDVKLHIEVWNGDSFKGYGIGGTYDKRLTLSQAIIGHRPADEPPDDGGGEVVQQPQPTFQDPSWSLIDMARNSDVFAIDSSGALQAKWYTPSTGGWSGWLNLGAPGDARLVGKPSALVSQVTGNLEVYARDSAGNVQQKWYTPSTGGWSGWLNLGKPDPALASDPVVVKDTAGNEDIFAIDASGALQAKWYTPSTGGWSGWLSLGAPGGTKLRGKPWAMVSQVTGNLEVYARDSAGNIRQKWYTPSTGGWSGWANLGHPGPALTSDPVVIKDTAGNEDVFAIDSAGTIWEKWYTPSTGGWSGWLNLGAPDGTKLRGRPWVMFSEVTGNVEVYAKDSAGNVQQLWYTPDTGEWSGWLNLGQPGPALASDPVVVKDTAGNEDVFATDSAGTFWEKWYTPGTRGWSGWLSLGSPG